MRHNSKNDLPVTIRALPEGAQEIYLEAYNHAWDESGGDHASNMARDSVAHRRAWAAMKQEYEQSWETGEWYLKREGPPQPHKAQSHDILGTLKKAVLGR
jgi:cation transport regulator ChaB